MRWSKAEARCFREELSWDGSVGAETCFDTGASHTAALGVRTAPRSLLGNCTLCYQQIICSGQVQREPLSPRWKESKDNSSIANRFNVAWKLKTRTNNSVAATRSGILTLVGLTIELEKIGLWFGTSGVSQQFLVLKSWRSNAQKILLCQCSRADGITFNSLCILPWHSNPAHSSIGDDTADRNGTSLPNFTQHKHFSSFPVYFCLPTLIHITCYSHLLLKASLYSINLFVFLN